MSSPDNETRKRLETWKEIAEFLRCDVKTAQRREKERGLPVYRLPGMGRTGVFAYEDEVLRWMHSAAQVAAPGEAGAKPAPSRRRALLWTAGAVGVAAGAAFPPTTCCARGPIQMSAG